MNTAGKMVAVITILLISGCVSRFPERIEECEIKPYVEQWDTVEDCKMAVLRLEDFRYKKEQQKLQDERNATECWEVRRQVWDHRSQRCKSWSML